MRSNIEIDGTLMRKALRASGLGSKSAVVEAALRLLVKVHGQSSIRWLRGKIVFDDDVRRN